MSTSKNLPGETLVALILSIPLAIMDGYFLTRLWQWWIRGTFHVHPLSIKQGIGLNLFVGFTLAGLATMFDDDDLVSTMIQVGIISIELFVLNLIVHLVMGPVGS